MILAIWYPSGGFGHFVNALISLRSPGFARPADRQILFSDDGNSHAVDLVLPKYQAQPDYAWPTLDQNLHYTVLIDKGINDESLDLPSLFDHSMIVKICYDDETWPVIANTMINKAMQSDLQTQLMVDRTGWTGSGAWQQREKFFLFLKDHPLRRAWRPDIHHRNLPVSAIMDQQQLWSLLESWAIGLSDAEGDWTRWQDANWDYLRPVHQARDIIEHVQQHDAVPLDHIVNVWDQAVIYYFLWLRYGKEPLHNDWAVWPSTTQCFIEWAAD